MPFVDIDVVSSELDVPVATIRKWIVTGYGPTSYKVGRHRRWDLDEVRGWVRGQADRPALTLDGVRAVLTELDRVGYAEALTASRVLSRVGQCEHPSWSREPGYGVCPDCDASPRLLEMLGLGVEDDDPCGCVPRKPAAA